MIVAQRQTRLGLKVLCARAAAVGCKPTPRWAAMGGTLTRGSTSERVRPPAAPGRSRGVTGGLAEALAAVPGPGALIRMGRTEAQ